MARVLSPFENIKRIHRSGAYRKHVKELKAKHEALEKVKHLKVRHETGPGFYNGDTNERDVAINGKQSKVKPRD